MASTIKLKNSTTKGNTPSSLEQGEVAINVNDGNLFYGDGSSVLQNFTFNHVTASGDISASGAIIAGTGTYKGNEEAAKTDVGFALPENSHIYTIDNSGGYLRNLIGKDNDVIKIGQSGTSLVDEIRLQPGSTGFTSFRDGSDAEVVRVDIVGNITASGNISASGTITANTLTSNNIVFTPGATSIKIEAPDESSGNVAGADLTIEAGNGFGSSANGGDITIQTGKGSGTGDGGNLIIQSGGGGGPTQPSGSIIVNGNNLNIDSTGNITASGNISSSGTGTNILGGNLNFSGDRSIGTVNETDDLDIKPGATLRLGPSSTDVIEIGRQSGTGVAGRTEIYANTSTPAAKFSLSQIIFNHPITASGNISASGNVIANNFIGTNIQLVSHAWFSNYASADWGLDLLTNGDDNFGWADRVWDHAVDKTDVPDSGTINSTGTFTHAHFNKGFRVNHNVTDIELIGVLRPNSSVNELNYYVYKGTPFNGTTDSTITFLASASSATAVTSRPNDIYITGSTGLQANKGDYIFVFANADLGSGNMKGSYTLTAKTRE